MAFLKCWTTKKFISRAFVYSDIAVRTIRRKISCSRSCRSVVNLAYASYETSSDGRVNDKADIAKTPPIVIMHGLFGSKNNWSTLAKAIHQRTGRKVIAVDARNHGDSPHSPTMTYEEMAKDVSKFLESIENETAILVGHSMGGATMMCTALNYPQIVEKLIVVDMSPIRTSKSLEAMSEIFEAMLGVEIKSGMSMSETRKSIDRQLARSIHSETLRQFLLTNLVEYEGSKYRWRVNLPILAQSFASEIAKFPETGSRVYEGPTLFVGGGNSDYIRREDHPRIKKLFPLAEFRYIGGAGHWVQSEKPTEFLEMIVGFVNKK